MGEFLNNFKNEASTLLHKKNLISLLVLGILVLFVPLVANVVRQQRIIKSQATNEPIVFVATSDLFQKNDRTWVTKKPQISFQITSPLGSPAGTIQASTKTFQSSRGLVKTAYAAEDWYGCSDWTSDNCSDKSKTCTTSDGKAGVVCTQRCTACNNKNSGMTWNGKCSTGSEATWTTCEAANTTTGGTCSIAPNLSPACTNCILGVKNKGGGDLLNTMKGFNHALLDPCSAEAIVTEWCRNVSSAECNSLKSGACSSSCGGSTTTPPSSGTPASSAPNANNVTCSISGPASVARGSKATYSASSSDTRVRTMEIYYNFNDRSAGGDYHKIATCNTDVTGLGGGCKGEFDSSVIPANKDGFAILCNAYSWKPTTDGTSGGGPAADCVSGNDDPIHCRPAGVDLKADACTGNPLWSTSRDFGWGGCSAASHKEITIGAAPVTTTSFRIAESLADFTDTPYSTQNPRGWQDYTAAVASTPINYTLGNTTPGLKTIFIEFKDSTGKKGGCGLNNSQPCQAQIRLLGSDPAVTSCVLSFEGNNTVLNLTGTNFGSDRGSAKSGDTSLQVKSWRDTSIQLVWPNAPVGQEMPVSLTNVDNQSGSGQCSAVSRLSLGAQVFCRAPSSGDTDNVDLVLLGNFDGGSKVRQKVKIDKDGVIQGLTQKLEAGKEYIISLKAPKSLRRTVSFTAGGGMTNIPNFVLPIGDIFPANGGNGKIDLFDKSELNRQWLTSQANSGRSADFNSDGRVNAIDWACMRPDYGNLDDEEPALRPSATPNPSASVSITPNASASASPASSASPVGSPSPSPSPSSSASSSDDEDSED